MSKQPCKSPFSLIASAIDPVGVVVGLPAILATAAFGIKQSTFSEVTSPSATKLRKQLAEVQRASRFLVSSLRDQHLFGYLNAVGLESNGKTRNLPVHNLASTIATLSDLGDRAAFAQAILQAPAGRKPQPNPGGLSAQETCAAIIFHAWTLARSDAPGMKNEEVFQICDDFWQACGQTTVGLALSGWRRHLTAARALLCGLQDDERTTYRGIIIGLFN